MSEFHNTKRVAIINKAGSGKSSLARYLMEEEIIGEKGYWIQNLWTNGELYSGNMFKGQVDFMFYNDKSIKLLDKETADKYYIAKEGERIWNPLRYQSSDRKEGVHLHKIKSMKDLPVQDVQESKEVKPENMGIIQLEEMFKCLPARRSGSQYNLVYGGLMANIRHVQCHFVGTDQLRKGADVFIRGNIDDLCVPIAPLPDGSKPLEYWVYTNFNDSNFDFLKNPPNPLEQALESTKVTAKNIWNLYTTIDIPPLLYDEPFGVKAFADELCGWRLPSNDILGEKFRDWTIRSPELRSYIILYEELEKKRLTESQRRALTAYLDTMGLLKKWSPKPK